VLRLILPILFCVLFASYAPEAKAHGGGLNAEGCHRERATGGYHCHRTSAPARPSQPLRSTAAARGDVYFANCAAARAAGAAPLRRGDPGYRPEMDGDGDGVACEWAGRGGSQGVTTGALPAAAPVTLLETAGARGLSGDAIVGEATALDGDTLTINGQRIRLFGVDAFEAEQRCPGAGRRNWGCGGVATRSLQSLVADTTTVCFPRDIDAYQRTVAVCRAGGTDLAAAMVVRGLAVAYARYSHDYDAEQELAKSGGTGAWSGAFVDPETYRRSGAGSASARAGRLAPETAGCVIKGNIGSKGRKLYHMPGDHSYEGVQAEAMFCSEEEALAAGFLRPRGN